MKTLLLLSLCIGVALLCPSPSSDEEMLKRIKQQVLDVMVMQTKAARNGMVKKLHLDGDVVYTLYADKPAIPATHVHVFTLPAREYSKDLTTATLKFQFVSELTKPIKISVTAGAGDIEVAAKELLSNSTQEVEMMLDHKILRRWFDFNTTQLVLFIECEGLEVEQVRIEFSLVPIFRASPTLYSRSRREQECHLALANFPKMAGLQDILSVPPEFIPRDLCKPLSGEAHRVKCKKDQTGGVCCIDERYIDFKYDMGISGILAPGGFMLSKCRGHCESISSYTNLIKFLNRPSYGDACCQPIEKSSIDLMYHINGFIQFARVHEAYTTACACD